MLERKNGTKYKGEISVCIKMSGRPGFSAHYPGLSSESIARASDSAARLDRGVSVTVTYYYLVS